MKIALLRRRIGVYVSDCGCSRRPVTRASRSRPSRVAHGGGLRERQQSAIAPITCGTPRREIEELRAALVEFARHYNETWLVARHGNRTPAQVRAAQSQLDQNAMADLKLAA